MNDDKTPRTSLATFLVALLAAPLALAALSGGAVAAGPGLVLAINLGDPTLRTGLIAAGVPECNGANGPYCFDFIPATLLTTLDFDGRQAMIVGWTVSALNVEFAALQAKASWVETFVDGGGGLIAYYEDEPNRYLWIPEGTQFASASSQAEILLLTAAGATHPSHAGQSGGPTGTLSNWINSYHGIITSRPTYLTHVLTTDQAGRPVTVAGPYGEGCVLVSGMDPEWHAQAGLTAAKQLVRSEVDWAIRCGCHAGAPCEPMMTLQGEVVEIDDEIRPDEVRGPAWAPTSALFGEDERRHEHPEEGRTWTYVGPVRIDVEFCDCVIVGFQVLYQTINDVPPAEPDFMTPLTIQTGYSSWTVSIPDGDTYEITFTVYLDCPEGPKELTSTWNQFG